MPKQIKRGATIHDGMGVEPTWLDQNDLSEQELKLKIGSALNWYNYFYEKKKGKATLISYLKKTKHDAKTIKLVQKAPDFCIGSTVVAIARMRMNGLERTVPGANTDEFLEKRLASIVEHGRNAAEPVAEVKSNIPVKSIQQRTFETACGYAEAIEDAIEEFDSSGYKTSEFDTFKHLRGQQVKAGVASIMLRMYSGQADELEEALAGKCEQLNEGYSHLKKAQLKRYAKFMRGICDDLERWVSNQKATRAPRKTKAKPIGKIVEKMKFARSNEEYKLQSIPPEKVIGAEQLWVFNVKYRTLGVYNAMGPAGLSVKGTTLQGFDEATSIKKKLRKPDDILKRCVSGGKIVMRKLMDEVNSKESALNGRLNEETILLRVA
jgi:hypothetical protein